MPLRNAITKQPLSMQDVRDMFPSTCFPDTGLTANNCADFGLEWYEETPAEPQPPTIESVQMMRQMRYKNESDGLYIEAIKDGMLNNTAPDFTAWLAKVEQIRTELPYPE